MSAPVRRHESRSVELFNRRNKRLPHTAIATVFSLVLPSIAAAQPDLIVADGLNLISSGDTYDLGETAVDVLFGLALTMRNVGDEVLDVSSLTASPEGPAEVVAISGLADINP
ncbi:MAG: hypothetical protein PVI86_16255, partial [Phycisphaerae bacterium]